MGHIWGRIRVATATAATLLGASLVVGGLSAAADAAAPFAASPGTLKFGAAPFQGDLVEQSVTVTNRTGGAAEFRARIGSADRAQGFTIEGGHLKNSLDYCVFNDVLDWGGTASIQLAAGQACVVTISYEPGDHARTSSGLLRLSTTVGPEYAKSIGLTARTGTILAPPGTLTFGDRTVGAPPVTQTITITNVSGQRIELAFSQDPAIDSAYYDEHFTTFDQAGSCVVGGTFQRFLDNRKSCTISVTLATDQLGLHHYNFLPIVRRADSGDSYPWVAQPAIPVSMNGVLPSYTVSPESYVFGTVTVGQQSGFQTFKVKNTSSAPERIGVDVGSDGDTDVTRGADSCGGVLPVQPGKTCTVRLALTPHQGGMRAVFLRLFLREPGGGEWAGTEKLVPMLVIGTAPKYSVSAKSIKFGNVVIDQTALKVVEVKNTSKVDVQVRVTPPTGAGFDLISGTSRCDGVLPRPLGPGETCFLYLAFHPTSLGQASGSLSIDLVDRSGHSIPESVRSLTFNGNGVDPQFTISPTNYDFGNTRYGTAKSVTVTVTNKSGGPIPFDSEIQSASAGFTAVGSGKSPCSPTTMVPSRGKCTYLLTFNPGELGFQTAQLNIWPTGLPTFTQFVGVSGTAFQPGT
ncbi:choice-of-anchor D domain-containing protein [Nocardioides humilatus]|nr:choice-of-anchor D domain-containing protein [Nocardioides humilatus]